SNMYRIRVLGLPPLADADTLIPWDWVEDAVDRDMEPLDDDPKIMAIDLARFGDDFTAIVTGRGLVIDPIVKYKGLDTMAVANWVIAEAHDFEPDAIFVDVIGIGAGLADILRERLTYTVVDVNISEVASEDGRFRRLRDELWWKMREAFEQRRIKIPND